MKLTISQFLTLQDYGYTIDEIRDYEGTMTEPAPGANGSADHARGEQPEQAQTKPETNPEPKPETKTETTPAPNPENDTQTMLRELLGIVRRGNINGLGGTVEQQDPAQIVASILAPNK